MISKNIVDYIINSKISENEKIEFLKEYLDKNPKLLNDVDEKGHTLLYWACNFRTQNGQLGLPKVAEFLIKSGTDIKALDNSLKKLLLSVAIKSFPFDVVASLCESTEDIRLLVDYHHSKRFFEILTSRAAALLGFSDSYIKLLKLCIEFNGVDLWHYNLHSWNQCLWNLLVKINHMGTNFISFCIQRKNIKMLKLIYSRFDSKYRDQQRNTLVHLIIKENESAVTLAFLEEIKNVRDIDQFTLSMEKISLEKLSVKQDILLFLGSGNMTFELSFAKKHPEFASKMIVTTYQEETKEKPAKVISSLEQWYSGECGEYAIFLPNDVHRIIPELIKLHVTIIFQIDARKLNEYEYFKDRRLSRVYFCHPCVKGRSNQTGQLVYNFFKSVSKCQQKGDRVIIARRTDNALKNGKSKGGWGYGFRQLPRISPNSDRDDFYYLLSKKHKFGENRYSGYKHVTSGSASSPYKEGESVEYVFEKTDYANGYISPATDSDSDTEVSCLEERNRLGQTALHDAVKLGDEGVVEKLLELGAEPNTIDNSGRCPLHYSLDYETPKKGLKIAFILLKFGANPEFLSPICSISTPLQYARETHKSNFKKLFKTPSSQLTEMPAFFGKQREDQDILELAENLSKLDVKENVVTETRNQSSSHTLQ